MSCCMFWNAAFVEHLHTRSSPTMLSNKIVVHDSGRDSHSTAQLYCNYDVVSVLHLSLARS